MRSPSGATLAQCLGMLFRSAIGCGSRPSTAPSRSAASPRWSSSPAPAPSWTPARGPRRCLRPSRRRCPARSTPRMSARFLRTQSAFWCTTRVPRMRWSASRTKAGNCCACRSSLLPRCPRSSKGSLASVCPAAPSTSLCPWRGRWPVGLLRSEAPRSGSRTSRTATGRLPAYSRIKTPGLTTGPGWTRTLRGTRSRTTRPRGTSWTSDRPATSPASSWRATQRMGIS
mmetsp:Transcript_67842/g.220884  ORF Transcript_67842/g.220884 Transcript_67842/m.220884 type:complete len:228 (-) Transcript_67842:2123-2806(-)